MSITSKESWLNDCPSIQTLEHIIGNKKPVEVQPIIYFLISGDEIVYIGKSLTGWARIYKHILDGVKSFTHYYYHYVPEQYLNLIEKRYIKHYTPKYNTIHNINKNPESKFTIDENGKRVFRIKVKKNFHKWSGREHRRWLSAYGS